ncbi:MAG: UTP--glucose-1-phosphate uridylyltransferase GalU, partial [Clostridia bacterium]
VKKAIIPAAGFGTRMLPATKAIPKEMLPLVDKPGIQYIVEEAVASGIQDILIIISRGKSPIEDHFDYSPELSDKLRGAGRIADADALDAIADLANITFLRQKVQRGLGHAVWCARSFTGDEPFGVLLGDDVMAAEKPVLRQLIDASEEFNASSVSVNAVPLCDISKYCSLDVSPVRERIMDVHGLIEKPSPDEVMSNYAILGRYVLDGGIHRILETLPAGHGGEIQLTDALDVLCKKHRLLAVDFIGTRYDTGNLRGYLRAVVELALQNPEDGEWFRGFINNLR